MPMTLPSGDYTIENVKNHNWAILQNDDDASEVISGNNASEGVGEKWTLKKLSNGNHLLQNLRYSNYATYSLTETLGDKGNVLSIREGIPSEWKMKSMKIPHRYTISDLHDRCWSLWDDFPCTPIKLERYQGNERQHWIIVQDISDLQVTKPLPSFHRFSHSASDSQPSPHSVPKTHSPGRNVVSLNRASGVASCCDITADLIFKIRQLMISGEDSLDEKYPDLTADLDLLHITISCAGMAVRFFMHTPLGQGIANTIDPHVQQCFTVLREVFDEIHRYRQGLEPTLIRYLWRQVCWSAWRGDNVARLREKLAVHRKPLDGLLRALDSVVWEKFRDQMRTNHISFEKFSTVLELRRPSLRHIPLITVDVVDHLGAKIPVPIMFCSEWKDFDYIINGYCNDRIGDRFIKRGDYEVLRAHRAISPSQLAKLVEPGMVLEMSIVLRQENPSEGDNKVCPKCQCINSNIIPTEGWIEWQSPLFGNVSNRTGLSRPKEEMSQVWPHRYHWWSKRLESHPRSLHFLLSIVIYYSRYCTFHAICADENSNDKDDDSDEESSKEGNEQLIEEHLGNEEGDGENEGHIISPASQGNSSDTKLFRLIHVILLNNPTLNRIGQDLDTQARARTTGLQDTEILPKSLDPNTLEDERITEGKSERRYRLLLSHEFHPSLTLPLWTPSPVSVGAVGYLSKPRGMFVTLFDAFDPIDSSGGVVSEMSTLSWYGLVKKRQAGRNMTQKGRDFVSGLLTPRKNDGPVSKGISRRQSFPLRAGHRTPYLCAESTTYEYFESLDVPKQWFKANVDKVMELYGAQHSIQKEDLYFVIGTLKAEDYALFISHRHPDGQVHFNVSSPRIEGEPWGVFTTDTESPSEQGGPPYHDEAPGRNNILSASKVSVVGQPLQTILLARLRFKPDALDPTSL